MNAHLYFGIESINLTNAQKQSLIDALRALQSPPAKLPHVNHIRIRTDNNAAVFEALLDDDWLTIPNLKQYLATIFNVNVSLITHTTANQSYGGGTTLAVTLSYQGTQRVRVALFGGVGATYAQSHAEVRGYLITNKAAWELVL